MHLCEVREREHFLLEQRTVAVGHKKKDGKWALWSRKTEHQHQPALYTICGRVAEHHFWLASTDMIAIMWLAARDRLHTHTHTTIRQAITRAATMHQTTNQKQVLRRFIYYIILYSVPWQCWTFVVVVVVVFFPSFCSARFNRMTVYMHVVCVCSNVCRCVHWTHKIIASGHSKEYIWTYTQNPCFVVRAPSQSLSLFLLPIIL